MTLTLMLHQILTNIGAKVSIILVNKREIVTLEGVSSCKLR